MIETQKNFLEFRLGKVNIIGPTKVFKLSVEKVMQLSMNNTNFVTLSIQPAI